MKVIVRSKFLGRTKRRGIVVASNETATQVKLAVVGLPYHVWVSAKDVQFV